MTSKQIEAIEDVFLLPQDELEEMFPEDEGDEEADDGESKIEKLLDE